MAQAKHIQDLIVSRRAVLGGLLTLPLLRLDAEAQAPHAQLMFASVAATNADGVSLPPGYRWRSLIAWGDALFDTVSATFDPDALTRAEQEQRFGQNNDMLAVFAAQYAFPPPRNPDRLILCANNEYASPELSYPALQSPSALTAEHVEALYAAVGISVVELERQADNWRAVRNAAPGAGFNRRITPFTAAVFTGPAAQHPWILEASRVVNAIEPSRGHEAPGAVRCGTLANCAGGLTPWGTYLSAEENFDGFFSGRSRDTEALSFEDPAFALDAMSFGYPAAGFSGDLTPHQFRMSENPRGPSLYGWVMEVDPHDVHAPPRKRTALGRMKHECATTALSADDRVVVYMGDDQRDEHVYKFVSSGRFNPDDRRANFDLLDDGALYCARFDENGQGQWIRLTRQAANRAAEREGSPIRFRDEADMLMRVRDAARLMGATPMDRPEDVEAVCDDRWRGLGPALIVCTNNSERGFERPGNPRRESDRPFTAQSNLPGHILRLDEHGGDCAAERFVWGVFVMGGDPNAHALTAVTRAGAPANISTVCDGAQTVTGDRFACPDNIFIDHGQRLWIATDGSDAIFGDCNDSILATPLNIDAPRPVKRFLVGPVGGEICGPLMAPDERAFFCSIQHPGANDVAGVDFSQLRWQGAAPTSHFPDGGDAWPRSAVIVVTKDDGGRIGD